MIKRTLRFNPRGDFCRGTFYLQTDWTGDDCPISDGRRVHSASCNAREGLMTFDIELRYGARDWRALSSFKERSNASLAWRTFKARPFKARLVARHPDASNHVILASAAR